MKGDVEHPAVKLALGWVRAWNDRDGDGFLPLVHPGFRMHRLSGEIIDIDGVRELVKRQSYGVGMSIFPRRLFGRDEVFVVEARVEYRYVETGELGGEKDDAAVVFEVKDGLLHKAEPKMSFGEAMEAAGLSEGNLIVSLASD